MSEPAQTQSGSIVPHSVIYVLFAVSLICIVMSLIILRQGGECPLKCFGVVILLFSLIGLAYTLYLLIKIMNGEYFQAGMTDAYFVILLNNLKMFPIESLEFQTAFDIMCATPLTSNQQAEFDNFKKMIGIDCNIHGLNLHPDITAV